MQSSHDFIFYLAALGLSYGMWYLVSPPGPLHWERGPPGMDMSLSKLQEMVKDREAWHQYPLESVHADYNQWTSASHCS